MKLSGYILTYNSEKYLKDILDKMSQVCDEILLIDSGSDDNTIQIADSYGAKIIYKPFDNYTSQRNFAHSQCQYDYVLWMDSDELPSDELISFLIQEKRSGFRYDIYSFLRRNHVLGNRVRVFYPVYDPEYRERLCRKYIRYESQLIVHETLDRSFSRTNIELAFDHFTFESYSEINSKLIKYAKLYAQQANTKGKPWKMFLSPWAAWFKWYIIKGGIKDGWIGFVLGLYVFCFTFLKYGLAINLKEK